LIRGFKDFFLRSNVIHLSVAVILGTAFTAAVTSVANNWISPLFAAFGGRNPNGLAVTLVSGNVKSVMDFGAILTALTVFAIIATVVYYLIVMPVKEIQLKRMWAVNSKPPMPTEVELLADIRGLLRQQQGQNGGAVSVPSGPPSLRVTQPGDSSPMMIEVTRGFSSRMVVFPGNTPGLLIEYGGNQMAFAVGNGTGAVVHAHDFAVGLAYAALAFADRCRIQVSPRHSSAKV
jgi:large conductance mechanosensitive channel